MSPSARRPVLPEFIGSRRMYAWRSVLLEDGWPHERDEHGFCENCGATYLEPHYLLAPRVEPVDQVWPE